jgi:hypothetical protein
MWWQKLWHFEKMVQWLKTQIPNVKVWGSNNHTCKLLNVPNQPT